MISPSFLLIFSITLHFSKIGALIMRSKVNHYFLVIAGKFLLILLDTALYDDIHVVISFSLRINFYSSIIFFKN